jgi:DNA-binding NarL/FixJ family response regulator
MESTEPKTPLRVFVADDVSDMRALVRFALEDAPDMLVVGEAGNGVEAVEGIASTHPDVVLLDLSMPDLDGLEVIPAVLAQSPDTGIVVFSGFEAARMRGPTTELGAHRYVEKGRPLDELRTAIREVGAAKRGGTLRALADDDPGDSGGGGSRGGLSTMWSALTRLRPRPRLGPAPA